MLCFMNIAATAEGSNSIWFALNANMDILIYMYPLTPFSTSIYKYLQY